MQLSGRLNFIDALRGLTMISVVMVHVLVRSFGLNPLVSGLAVMRTTFTLPLFFLVSGFFAWRPVDDYTLPKARRALSTRLKALLLGTIVFNTLYLITLRKDPFSWINGDFDAYWYTFSLLQIFIFFLLTVSAGKLLHSSKAAWIILIAGGVAGAIASEYVQPLEWRFNWLCTQKTMLYAQFFVLGALVRRFSHKFFSLLEIPLTLSVIIVIYVASLILFYYFPDDLKEIGTPLFITVRYLTLYSGVMLLLAIFYRARNFFDSDTRFIRSWLFIGRRTLDIYFLHYFLLPQMRWVGPYLTKGNTFILQLAAGLAVALFIIAVALGISRLLRKAPYISSLLGDRGSAKGVPAAAQGRRDAP